QRGSLDECARHEEQHDDDRDHCEHGCRGQQNGGPVAGQESLVNTRLLVMNEVSRVTMTGAGNTRLRTSAMLCGPIRRSRALPVLRLGMGRVAGFVYRG